MLDKHVEDLRGLANRVTGGYVDPLVEPILSETEAGWHVLETGSGWGSLSATLAHYGRLVILMDWSQKIVDGGVSHLNACDVSGKGVCADLFVSLPFADKSFDCVWSSGVLEHFRSEEQIRILRESARVARYRVISLVPNALSLAYRVGKLYMHHKGTWEFGYERPEISQRTLFKAAGLKNIRETTVNADRSGWFLTSLPQGDRLRLLWLRLCQTWPKRFNTTARQGYMLTTVGDTTES